MINSELVKLTGTPLNASAGKHTRSDNEASGRATRVDLGMSQFNAKAGENRQGKFIGGVTTPDYGTGPKRSSLRSAGESR